MTKVSPHDQCLYKAPMQIKIPGQSLCDGVRGIKESDQTTPHYQIRHGQTATTQTNFEIFRSFSPYHH